MRLALQSLRKTDSRQMIETVSAFLRQGLAPQLVDELIEAASRRRRTRARSRTPGALFEDIDPTVRAEDHLSPYTLRLIERLRAADEATALCDQPLRVAARA